MTCCGITLQNLLSCLFLSVGLIFLLGSLVGMLRLPDFYSRVHASGNSETLGSLLIFIGLAIYNGWSVASAKIIFISIFVFIGNPIGSHILAKAAYKTGLPIWTQKHPVADMREEVPEEANQGKGSELRADLHN